MNDNNSLDKSPKDLDDMKFDKKAHSFCEGEKVNRLKNAIQEGIDSGTMMDFDSKEHLNYLKLSRRIRKFKNALC